MKHSTPVAVVFAESAPAQPPAPAPQPKIRAERNFGEWIWIGAFVAVALLVPLIYVSITHHQWEDWFITFRHSKNLVEGRGLVFNPGERVHGFTSAINVMLPAFFYWITGKNGYETSLNLYRAASLIVYVLGGVVTLRLMLRDRGIDRLSPLLFLLLYVTEAKTIAFTMNGQECGFMVGFLSLAFAASYWGLGKSWWIAALAWAGLLYTRPDSPIYIAGLAITALAFRKETLRESIIGILKAGALAAIIYLPWFISMWVYYGNPTPHTAIAKPNFTVDNLINPVGLLKSVLQNYPLISGWVFEPGYSVLGGWPQWLLDPYGLLCAVICTGYWMIPSADRLGRMASLAFMCATLYLAFINVGAFTYPWYIPSAAVFGTIVLARAPVELVRRVRLINRWPFAIDRAVQGAIVTISLLFFVATVYQIRIQQRELEDNHRKQVGLYLHEKMKPNEKAYMEPLGYIGYFSDRYIYDWPGLVSPEVVRLRKEKKVNQISIIPELMPDWLVLRPAELNAAAQIPQIQQHYEISKIFDVRDKLKEHSYIPGRGYLDFDAVLVVVHRKEATKMSF